MRPPRPALVIRSALLAVVVGCNTLHGVERSALEQSPPPTTQAIRAAILATPGIARCQVRPVPVDRAPNGRVIEAAFDQYAYRAADHTRGLLEVRDLGNDTWTWRLYAKWPDVPTPAELRRARSVMDDVYASLRRCDPDLPPPAAVHEELVNVPSP